MSGQRDSDGFAMPAPPAKRQLRPSASVPTTSETYGAKHGIPEDIQRALENVGRRARQNVTMGPSTNRTFDRTQSVPTNILNNPPRGGFTTALDDIADARRVLSIERLRERELKPFSVSGLPNGHGDSRGVDALALAGREDEEERTRRRLKFGADGEVEEEEIDWGGEARPVGSSKKLSEEDRRLVQARKRRSSPAEPHGSDTETDGEDEDEAPTGVTFNTIESVFPPVFSSPALSHPQLFADSRSTTTSGSGSFGFGAGSSSGSRNAFAGARDRQFRGLPGARKGGLGKTVSAPVGGLKRWGDMDVDEDEGADAGGAEGTDGFEFDWSENVEF
ncbi:hypothetical protein IAT38_001901 [Cryptococcus sp. DSM 104549]